VDNDNIFRKIEKLIAMLCWKIYVRLYWRKNLAWRKKLSDPHIAENLVYFMTKYNWKYDETVD